MDYTEIINEEDRLLALTAFNNGTPSEICQIQLNGDEININREEAGEIINRLQEWLNEN